MAKGIAAQRFTLQSPGGTEELLQPQFQSTSVRSTVMFSGKKLTEPGVFKIRTGQTILAQFAVNVSQKESDLRKIPDAELENFFKTLGVGASQITLVKSDGKLNSVVLQSRYGVELWKFFLATALMLALIEMSVARGPRAEHRDASAASGE